MIRTERSPGLVRRMLMELLLAVRFGLVGCLATAIHMLIVWWLMQRMQVPPHVSNTLAFLCAFGVSFLGNYHWTFGAPGERATVLRRFFLTSLTAFGLNALMLSILLKVAWVTPFVSTLLAAACVPVFSFGVSRLWAFRVTSSR